MPYRQLSRNPLNNTITLIKKIWILGRDKWAENHQDLEPTLVNLILNILLQTLQFWKLYLQFYKWIDLNKTGFFVWNSSSQKQI